MAKFLSSCWNKIPPGASIAVMGLLAALYPILTTEPIPAREKALWIGCFFALMCLEMYVIFRERSRQDRAFIEQMGRIEEIRNLHAAHALALDRVRASVNKDGLRSRALNLSASMLEFVYKRLENEPQMPVASGLFTWRAAGSNEWFNNLQERQAYHLATGREYFDRFRDRVGAIYGEMTAMGISEEQISNALNEASVDTATIQFIGQGIGDLAEQLHND